MFILDITDERHPLPIATFQVPEEPGDFCHRGGRFGPHSFADAYHPKLDKKLVVLAYFNAGVRVVDIRNPFVPGSRSPISFPRSLRIRRSRASRSTASASASARSRRTT